MQCSIAVSVLPFKTGRVVCLHHCYNLIVLAINGQDVQGGLLDHGGDALKEDYEQFRGHVVIVIFYHSIDEKCYDPFRRAPFLFGRMNRTRG